MEAKEYKELYRKLGGVVRYLPPPELPAFYAQEDKKLKRLIDYSGFKPTE